MVLFAMQEAPAIVRFSARRRSRGRLAGRAISLALLRGGLGEFPAPPGFLGLGWVREKNFLRAEGLRGEREVRLPPVILCSPQKPKQAWPVLVSGWSENGPWAGLQARLRSGSIWSFGSG